jgi:hypothetical protein
VIRARVERSDESAKFATKILEFAIKLRVRTLLLSKNDAA